LKPVLFKKKKIVRLHFDRKKLGVAVHACHSAMESKIGGTQFRVAYLKDPEQKGPESSNKKHYLGYLSK
jgi:hypothetical protein